MTPFRLNHDELKHELPWLLMQNGPVTKYWRRDGFEADLAAMEALGFRVDRFDVGAWVDEDAMFCALRDGLGLPAHTGMNFDALADSLADMDVPDDGGAVIALDNFMESRRSDKLPAVIDATDGRRVRWARRRRARRAGMRSVSAASRSCWRTVGSTVIVFPPAGSAVSGGSGRD